MKYLILSALFAVSTSLVACNQLRSAAAPEVTLPDEADYASSEPCGNRLVEMNPQLGDLRSYLDELGYYYSEADGVTKNPSGDVLGTAYLCAAERVFAPNRRANKIAARADVEKVYNYLSGSDDLPSVYLQEIKILRDDAMDPDFSQSAAGKEFAKGWAKKS